MKALWHKHLLGSADGLLCSSQPSFVLWDETKRPQFIWLALDSLLWRVFSVKPNLTNVSHPEHWTGPIAFNSFISLENDGASKRFLQAASFFPPILILCFRISLPVPGCCQAAGQSSLPCQALFPRFVLSHKAAHGEALAIRKEGFCSCRGEGKCTAKHEFKSQCSSPSVTDILTFKYLPCLIGKGK